MYSEGERVQIRRWLGFPAVFLQAEPRLESAISATQSTADGGTRPDNSTEVAIRGYLAQLAVIEAQWLAYLKQMQASDVGKGAIRIDALRGLAGVRSVGRMYVGFIADACGTEPRRDAFSPPEIRAERAFW